jgi:hypothetical protein
MLGIDGNVATVSRAEYGTVTYVIFFGTFCYMIPMALHSRSPSIRERSQERHGRHRVGDPLLHHASGRMPSRDTTRMSFYWRDLLIRQHTP